MSIKLRGNPVHRPRWGSTQDNQALTGTMTFVATTGFAAQVQTLQQPQVMTAVMQFVSLSVPALVNILDASGNSLGYGPAADPQGAFFGAPIVSYSEETWGVISHPPGVLLTAQAGGRIQWNTGVAGTTYTYTARRYRPSTNTFTDTVRTYTPTANGAGDSAQFVPTMAHPVPDITSLVGVPLVINAYWYFPGVTFQGSVSPVAPVFSMTPSIPGMSINATTGLITGTPTAAVSGIVLRCTTPNGTVSDTFNFAFPVTPSAGSIVLEVAGVNPAQGVGAGNLTVLTPLVDGGDWMHFGFGSDTAVNRKDVVPRMQAQSLLGPQGGSIPNDPDWPRISWTDGVPPRVTVSQYRGGAFWWNINNGNGKNNGFKLSVQAGTRPRVLTMIGGAFEGPCVYEVSLSDGSAPPVTRSFTAPPTTVVEKTTITFNAASENQTLTVTGKIVTTGGIALGPVYLTEPGGATNMPPQLRPVGNKWGVVGVPITFDVVGIDFEFNVLNMTVVGALPPGATYVDHHDFTGTFTWTPTSPGTQQVTFRVTDPNSLQFAEETVTFTIAAGAVPQPSQPLRKNGRWFTYDNAPLYLIGGDSSSLAADVNFDYERVFDVYRTVGVNKIRLWIDAYWDPVGLLHPWVYNPGSQQYDLDTWNTAYWTRYKAVVEAARVRGIMVELSIFSGYFAWDTFWSDTNVRIAWNKAFNKQQAFTGQANGQFEQRWFALSGTETSIANPGSDTGGSKTLNQYQKLLIDKCVAEMGSQPNVMFEIMNEPYASSLNATGDALVGAWLQSMADYLKTQTTRLVSAAIEKGGAITTTIGGYVWDRATVDVLDAHLNSAANSAATISTQLDPAQVKDKILSQNEGSIGQNYYFNLVDPLALIQKPATINGIGVDYVTREMWGWFLAGGHYNIYELMWVNTPNWVATVGARIKAFRDIIATTNFSQLSPVDVNGVQYDTLLTAGPAGTNRQMAAQPGQQYVGYFWGTPTNVNAVVNFQTFAANYTYKWHDARDGSILAAGVIVSGGGTANIPPPALTTWRGSAGLILVIKKV